MSVRRSQRVGGSKLSDKLGEVERQARKQVKDGFKAARAARNADTLTGFRFMDLPPELRLTIYAYAMPTDESRDLTGLKAPTLALISKQVRVEVLPVFFSECTFVADMHSNYAFIDRINELAARNAPLQSSDLPQAKGGIGSFPYSSRTVGRLHVYARTKKQLAHLEERDGYRAVFKAVDLNVICRTNYGWKESSLFSLRAPRAKIEALTVSYTTPPSVNDMRPLQAMRKKATSVAEEIAASHEHFAGFTFAELESIAKVFRYWPVEE